MKSALLIDVSIHAPFGANLEEVTTFPNNFHPPEGGDFKPALVFDEQLAAPAGYAGDVSPQLACQWWQAEEAVLVDVRTDAERAWVGFVPGAMALAWKQWPDMALNPHFDEGLQATVPADKKIVFLCRSGVRSVAAARRATELGWVAYNILEGFEGDANEQTQRGHLGGWRFHGLPWCQG